MKKIGIFIFLATLLFSFSNVAFGSRQGSSRVRFSRVPGSLNISAEPSLSIENSTFSFEGELTSQQSLGALTVSDTRASRAGWTLDVTATDWVNENSVVMDTDGNGVTTGKFYLLVPTLNDITLLAGDSTAGLLPGFDSSFSPTNTVINVLTAPSGTGSGIYRVSAVRTQQFIPPSQDVGNYEMTLTYTIS